MRALRILLAGLCVAASVLAGRPAMASTSELVQHLDRIAQGFPGGIGLYIADPTTGKALYTRNPDEPIITASLYKLGVLLEAERRVDIGDLKYDDIVTIQPEDITDDGSFEPAGTELTLDRALEAMVTVSDNGSAQALWHLLGPRNIDVTLQNAGIGDFHVALDRNEDNVATPRAVGTFFTLLANRKLLSAAASDRMLARLERQQINNRLPASLPDGVVVAHKTGNLPGLTHDAGIIFTPSGSRVVVAMTWDSYPEDANTLIADIGSLVYAAVLEPPANARFAVPRSVTTADTGTTMRATITVTNAGSNAWAASGSDAVGLIWEMRDDNDVLVGSSPGAVPLPALLPAKSANVGLQIRTPELPGLFHVTVGLVDSDGRALALRGAATASFDVRTHAPFLVHASVAVPGILHRGEPSLLLTRYQALPTAGGTDHGLVVTWRALDMRNGRTVEEGSSTIGVLRPDANGLFYSALVAPKVLGRYRLSYELREGDVAVSETATTVVTVYGPRTYPDDQSGRTPGSNAITPKASPRNPIPFPSPSASIIPRVDLPNLPLPKGKATPAPTPH